MTNDYYNFYIKSSNIKCKIGSVIATGKTMHW
jgi:hypothetical protein